jgi:hypothetical protein
MPGETMEPSARAESRALAVRLDGFALLATTGFAGRRYRRASV